MNRFFITKGNIDGDVIQIEGKDYTHISKSLRLQPGDKIIVCIGDKGIDYLVELRKFNNSKNIVIGKIISKEKNKNEPDINISLAQAIPKNRNMELVAEKTTEMGIKNIMPLDTKRTVVKLNHKKKKKRIKRWQRIVEAAAKQSQRGIIPEVKDIHSIDQISKTLNQYDLVLVFWTGEAGLDINNIFKEKNLIKKEFKDILLMIGPEGGFTKKEVNLLKENESTFSITLGPRILRTETAGLAALSVILYEFGELGS